jgi:hypothetical protein
MRRWVAGSSDVPAGVYLDLLKLCQERAAEMDETIAGVRSFLAMEPEL